MKKNKNIPPRNYLILFLITAGVILGIMYFFEYKEVQEQELTSESYLISTSTVSLTINTLDELETALVEVPYDFFIFTGYTGDIDEYNLEVDLKPIIDEYSLADQFYYLNITDLLEDEDLYDDLSEILNTDIDSLPMLIYISNDKVANKVTALDDYLKASDFLKLLEMYDFKESN